MPGVIKDVNNIPQIITAIEDLNKYKLQIGIFAPEGSEQWIIAMVNEYGAEIKVTPKMRIFLHIKGLHLKASTQFIKIPERSFIRAGFESCKDELEQQVNRMLPLVLSLKLEPKKMYELLGTIAVGRIHKYVQSVRSPANHPFTIAGKGSSHPLINTGRMNQSITYKVVSI